MKQVYVLSAFATFSLCCMEPMAVDTKPVMDVCAKIALIKSMENPIVATAEEAYNWTSARSGEGLACSKSWLTTSMTSDGLFENQLWEEYQVLVLVFDLIMMLPMTAIYLNSKMVTMSI